MMPVMSGSGPGWRTMQMMRSGEQGRVTGVSIRGCGCWLEDIRRDGGRMKMKLLLIGLAGMVGCDKPAAAVKVDDYKPPFEQFRAPDPYGNENGRFVLYEGTSEGHKFTLRIDTQTGMTWGFKPNSSEWERMTEPQSTPDLKPAVQRWR